MLAVARAQRSAPLQDNCGRVMHTVTTLMIAHRVQWGRGQCALVVWRSVHVQVGAGSALGRPFGAVIRIVAGARVGLHRALQTTSNSLFENTALQRRGSECTTAA